MPHPSISVIIPTLNEERYLPSLLTDLSHQTYSDFEVIIVDGHSEDKTVTKAQQFAHRLPKLTILSSDVRNVCSQRNLGVKSAVSPLILFMDADNRLPTYFLQGFKYRYDLTQPDIFSSWVSGNNSSGDNPAIAIIINLYLDLRKGADNPSTIEAMLGFKKSVFEKLKGFDKKIAFSEGNDIVEKAIKKGFHYELFKDPTYSYSLRRLRKQGTLRMISDISQLEISHLIGQKVSRQKAMHLYPMNGGDFFNEKSIDQNVFDQLIKKLKLQKQKDKLINFAKSILFVKQD